MSFHLLFSNDVAILGRNQEGTVSSASTASKNNSSAAEQFSHEPPTAFLALR